MAAVFDIELHDVDTINTEDSDDDVIEIGEVKCYFLFRFLLIFYFVNKKLFILIFFLK